MAGPGRFRHEDERRLQHERHGHERVAPAGADAAAVGWQRGGRIVVDPTVPESVVLLSTIWHLEDDREEFRRDRSRSRSRDRRRELEIAREFDRLHWWGQQERLLAYEAEQQARDDEVRDAELDAERDAAADGDVAAGSALVLPGAYDEVRRWPDEEDLPDGYDVMVDPAPDNFLAEPEAEPTVVVQVGSTTVSSTAMEVAQGPLVVHASLLGTSESADPTAHAFLYLGEVRR